MTERNQTNEGTPPSGRNPLEQFMHEFGSASREVKPENMEVFSAFMRVMDLAVKGDSLLMQLQGNPAASLERPLFWIPEPRPGYPVFAGIRETWIQSIGAPQVTAFRTGNGSELRLEPTFSASAGGGGFDMEVLPGVDLVRFNADGRILERIEG